MPDISRRVNHWLIARRSLRICNLDIGDLDISPFGLVLGGVPTYAFIRAHRYQYPSDGPNDVATEDWLGSVDRGHDEHEMAGSVES